MGYYAKPEKQAQRVISWGLALGSGRRNNKSPALIHSISTANSYRSALTTFCRWIQENQLGNLIQVNVKTCSSFLEERAGQVGQKTLDRDRQAIQYLLGRTTRMKILLPRIKSTYSGGRHLAKQSRAYTRDQVEYICSNLSRRSALATRIAYAAGLRGHELYSLKRRSERAPSAHRKWSKDRFLGRAGVVYTVKGKGGLGARGDSFQLQLAKELELRRLPEPVTLRNRGINHQQHYDITAGQSFSHIFTKASVKHLGWSTGAHGLRHGYAQVRMDELHTGKFTRQERMEIVSQELGHFRPDIVKAYLR